MPNNWNIPDWLEKKVIERDKHCVYCDIKFKNNSYDKAEWEHINNNEEDIEEWNIAKCCHSCNASKGNKKLLDWLNSPNCKPKKNNINKKTVALIVRKYIQERITI